MIELSLEIILFCAAAAFAGGFIDAIAGGGGLLTIPALLISGVAPHYALGTNKIGAFLGTLVALVKFSRSHLVIWRIVGWGIGFSFLGSWLGSLLALHLNSAILGKIIVFLLPIGMVATLLPSKKKSRQSFELEGWKFWLLTPLVCIGIGCYDGFFGPATGSFLILALHWVLGMELLHASATAKAFNLASNFSAAIAFIWYDSVLWPLALIMGAFLMLGNYMGSRLAIKVGARAVRRFLILSLLLLLITLLWEYFLK